MTAFELSREGEKEKDKEGCVQLIVERARTGVRMDSEWPRYPVLQTWKKVQEWV